MPTKKVKIKKKRHSIAQKYMEWAWLLLIAAVSVFGAYSTNKLLNTDNWYWSLNSATARNLAPDSQFLMAQYERKVYPYSVIPGGVQSREELASNVISDGVVMSHYVDFDVSNARIVKVPETRFMYVSYRLKNKIYWTSKKIRIPQGETLITDGTCDARTRCGNRVSATPMTPTSDEEPDIETFDVPQLARLDLPQLEPVVEPGLPPLAMVDVPGLPPTVGVNVPPPLPWVPRPPGGGYPPIWGGEPPGGSAVPEPGTMVLMFTGLAAVAAIGIRRRKP
jgi:hypothetical protein